MAEVQIEERIISGSGVLRLPPLEAPIRYYSVLVDVIRLPTNIDRSLRYNPFRQRFATMVTLRGEYVIAEGAIDYQRRRYDYLVDVAGQNLISLKCAHAQTLSELGVTDPETNSAIATHSNLSLIWDEIRFVCYQDTALQVRLMAEQFDECGQPYYEKSPPPPPPPLEPVPPGTPIGDISPPYDDDDVTSPYPGDEIPEPEPTTGQWDIIVTIAGGGTAPLGLFSGLSTDTFEIIVPSPSCPQSGSSLLLRNGADPVFDPLNCNNAGFVSEIVSATFIPDSP